jgi:hypothetical protein
MTDNTLTDLLFEILAGDLPHPDKKIEPRTFFSYILISCMSISIIGWMWWLVQPSFKNHKMNIQTYIILMLFTWALMIRSLTWVQALGEISDLKEKIAI